MPLQEKQYKPVMSSSSLTNTAVIAAAGLLACLGPNSMCLGLSSSQLTGDGFNSMDDGSYDLDLKAVRHRSVRKKLQSYVQEAQIAVSPKKPVNSSSSNSIVEPLEEGKLQRQNGKDAKSTISAYLDQSDAKNWEQLSGERKKLQKRYWEIDDAENTEMKKTETGLFGPKVKADEKLLGDLQTERRDLGNQYLKVLDEEKKIVDNIIGGNSTVGRRLKNSKTKYDVNDSVIGRAKGLKRPRGIRGRLRQIRSMFNLPTMFRGMLARRRVKNLENMTAKLGSKCLKLHEAEQSTAKALYDRKIPSCARSYVPDVFESDDISLGEYRLHEIRKAKEQKLQLLLTKQSQLTEAIEKKKN